MLTLGIETSCDDTAAAVLEDGKKLLASVLTSQDLIHSPFGGIVPELASRRHLESIYPVVEEALSRANASLADIDLIAVTQGPGLIGSLLVGFCYAKAMAKVLALPYKGVDHMAGHILSIFLEQDTPTFPYIALIASGGTTSIYLARDFTSFSLLGKTRDDAAGEAFDKVAKLLGQSYPGGPIVAKLAESGEGDRIDFPRAWLEEDSLDFSFSGLKTAVMTYCRQQEQQHLASQIGHICASFQEAVVEVLVEKTLRAARLHDIDTVVLGGGVSANSRLRQVFLEKSADSGCKCFIPRPAFSTDNAAMIALAGYHAFGLYGPSSFAEDVFSRSQLG